MATLRLPSGLQVNGTRPMTLAVLGCGTLGIAILSGILTSLSESPSSHPSPAYPGSGTATPTTDTPSQTATTPSRFITLVRRPQSAKRIRDAISSYPQSIIDSVKILQNDNIAGVTEADVIILGCKPYMVAEILREEGMREALAGKLLISICAGVSVDQLSDTLYEMPYSQVFSKKTTANDNTITDPCRLVRVMPNTAAVVRESMTVIATTNPPLPEYLAQLTSWIFTRVGRVVNLPAGMMDVSTALCGSGPAFLALMMESMADGAVAMGLPRAEAQLMAAQTMRGTAGMVLAGEHPALVREKVSTPGGCTIGGLLVLEEGRVRGTVARSVREATVVAGELGKGVSGVNGTRF